MHESTKQGPGEGERNEEHVSERFARLLDLYRKPDGSEWGGRELEVATGGVVTRSYVSNLKRGRMEHPGMDKLGALASAMGFPPGLWFGDEGGFADGALLAALQDETNRKILEQAMRLGRRDRRLLLGIARQIGPPADEARGERNPTA